MSESRKITTSRRTALYVAGGLLLAVAGAVLLSGCNIAGPAFFLVTGRPKVPAQYELPEGRTVVVFIDDRRSILPRRSLRMVIGQTAEEAIIENTGLSGSSVIPSRAAMRATASESFDNPMSIVDLGRVIGAEVVIYARVSRWTLSREGAGVAPAATVDVKVVDALNNERLWPQTMEAYPTRVELPMRADQRDPSSDPAIRARLEDTLAKAVGREVARLFYKYMPETASDYRTNQAN